MTLIVIVLVMLVAGARSQPSAALPLGEPRHLKAMRGKKSSRMPRACGFVGTLDLRWAASRTLGKAPTV